MFSEGTTLFIIAMAVAIADFAVLWYYVYYVKK